MSELEKLYTVTETADFLRLSQKSIWNYIKLGLLKPKYLRKSDKHKSGRTLIPENQIINLLEN